MCGLHIHTVLLTHPHLWILHTGIYIQQFDDPIEQKLSGFHLFVMCVPQEFPLEWEWWLILVLSSVLMASLGEYICSKAELEDIPLYNPN